MNDHTPPHRDPQPGAGPSPRPASDTAASQLNPDSSAALHAAGVTASANHNPGGQHPAALLTERLTVEQVRELIDRGVAEPLLGDDFPVPVRIDGQWWHLPDDPTTPPTEPVTRGGQDTAGHYRRSPPQLAAQLDRHARRLQAADAAQRPHRQEPTVPPP